MTPGVTRFQISEIGQKLKPLGKRVPPPQATASRLPKACPEVSVFC